MSAEWEEFIDPCDGRIDLPSPFMRPRYSTPKCTVLSSHHFGTFFQDSFNFGTFLVILLHHSIVNICAEETRVYRETLFAVFPLFFKLCSISALHRSAQWISLIIAFMLLKQSKVWTLFIV